MKRVKNMSNEIPDQYLETAYNHLDETVESGPAVKARKLATLLKSFEDRGRKAAIEQISDDYEQIINSRDYHGNCCLGLGMKLIQMQRKKLEATEQL